MVAIVAKNVALSSFPLCFAIIVATASTLHGKKIGSAADAAAALKGTVVRLPERHEMESQVEEQLIVEYYSR